MHVMRHRYVRAALIALPLLVGAGAAVAQAFGPIRVGVNRHEYRGRFCPVEIVYTGTINFVLPHPPGFVFNYYWERSDGARSPMRVVRPSPGERTLVLREPWRIGAPGREFDVSEVLHVNSGNTHITEAGPTVHIDCR
jgi:hypothetical protein